MSDTVDKYREYVITGFVKAVQPIVIERAQGAIVTDEAGRDYIDCFAGIAVVNAGHCNPEVLAAAREQMEKLVHCASYVYHTKPVGDLAEKMAQITPGRLKKSFFANSGAEAIEGALKLARLYTGKTEIISLTHSFHGRTWAALSVTGNAGRKRRGGPYASGVAFAPAPYMFRSLANSPEELGEQCAQAIEEIIQYSTSDDVGAFIAEPLLGEGGLIVPPGNYFQAVKRVLDRHGILFIADGFPLGAFTTRDEIAAAFRPGDHLSTFGGNPVSCAAALANIKFIEREGLSEKAREDGEYVMGRLHSMQEQFPLIGEVRGMGLMIGIELVADEALTPAVAQAEAIRAYCLEQGVLVGVGGVYGNVVRIQPPLVITRHQLDAALGVLWRALAQVTGVEQAGLQPVASNAGR